MIAGERVMPSDDDLFDLQRQRGRLAGRMIRLALSSNGDAGAALALLDSVQLPQPWGTYLHAAAAVQEDGGSVNFESVSERLRTSAMLDRVGGYRGIEALKRGDEIAPGPSTLAECVEAYRPLDRILRDLDAQAEAERLRPPVEHHSFPASAQPAPPSPLVTLDVAGLLARGGWEPVPVLDDFLWNKTFTYLSGASGSFKTWLMLTWAVALVMNKPFIRQAVHGDHRILFVECESSVQILQRLPKVCAAYGVDLAGVLERLRFVVPDGRALRLEDPAHSTHVMQLAKDHGATWVFIDSLRRCTSLNENHAEDMSRLADTAFLPLRDAGHNVLLLEHPAKPMQGVTRNRKESMRGSGDKSAAADVVLHVDALETEQGRVAALSVAKCRFAPERDEPLFMRLRPTGNDEGLGFEEVEEPEQARQGRKATRLEQARNIIAAERGRDPNLNFAQAVRAVVNAGLSRRTAARAWEPTHA